jgi:predicted O-methyltransferase YrrM
VALDSWTAVDDFIVDRLVPPDPALDAALESSAAAGLPAIHVTPNQGKLLHLLARVIGARRILEIGTLGGYSTIWLARALPADGRLITLEVDPRHAAVASANIQRAGLDEIAQVRVGPAGDTLQQLVAERCGPFDLIFIDADKANTAEYFTAALQLSRPGSLIVIDNVIRDGKVLDSTSTDPNIQGVRRFFELAASESRVTVTAIQTVGSKGYDGLAIALVVPEQSWQEGGP